MENPPLSQTSLKMASGKSWNVSIPGVRADELGQMQRLECDRTGRRRSWFAPLAKTHSGVPAHSGMRVTVTLLHTWLCSLPCAVSPRRQGEKAAGKRMFLNIKWQFFSIISCRGLHLRAVSGQEELLSRVIPPQGLAGSSKRVELHHHFLSSLSSAQRF